VLAIHLLSLKFIMHYAILTPCHEYFNH